MSSIIKTDQYEYHKSSIIAPTATFLEDIYESIQDYVRYLVEKKFNVLITKEPNIVIEQYKKVGNSSLYSFDTKMDNVAPMIHGRSTHRGAAAGPATICSMTNDGEENHIEFCAALSEHDDIEEANTTFSILESNGQSITKIHKDHAGNFEKFESMVDRYTESYTRKYKPGIFEEYFVAIEKSFGDISRHPPDFPLLSTLMGYPGSDSLSWSQGRGATTNVYGEDVKDRIEALRYIKEGLMAALGQEDHAEQAEWMYESRVQLGRRSAWDLLESGKLDDMRAVAALVNRLLG